MLQSWKKEGTSGWGDQGGIGSGTWHTTGVLGWCFANFRITFPLIVCLFQIPCPITSLAFWELTHLPLIFFSDSLHLYLVPWFYPRPGYLFGLGSFSVQLVVLARKAPSLNQWDWMTAPEVFVFREDQGPQTKTSSSVRQVIYVWSGWLLLNTEVLLMGFKFLI